MDYVNFMDLKVNIYFSDKLVLYYSDILAILFIEKEKEISISSYTISYFNLSHFKLCNKPAVRFGLTTYSLRESCSTPELRWHFAFWLSVNYFVYPERSEG